MHIDWKPGLLCCAHIECELGIGMAAWIEMIDDDDADEELLDVLNLSRTPHGTVDNVMRVHSLRPSTMQRILNLCGFRNASPVGFQY